MLLPLLLLLAPPDADAVVKRCSAYFNAAKTLSVRVEATSSKMPGKGLGVFTFKSPSNVAFKMKWGGEAYSYWGDADGGLEIEAANRVYDESGFSSVRSGPLCRISEIPVRGYPMMILPGALSRVIPSSGTKKLLGSERVGGSAADHVQLANSGPQGKIAVDLWIRKDGALLQFKLALESPTGNLKSSVAFSDYAYNKELPKNAFASAIPRGYMPLTFAEEPVPIQPGGKMPTTGWVDAKTGNDANFDQNRPGKRLYAVVSNECEPSRRALDTIRELSLSVQTVVLTTSTKPSAAWVDSGLRLWTDPKGKNFAVLQVPGTPFFILTDAKNTVEKLWYGFDPQDGGAFKKDVLQSVASKADN